ncbi:MAG TPA: hypothetical protein VGB49_02505, partial [Caulobacteraceae bacterium]
GLQPGGPGCRPNVLVLATNDAGALSSALVESNEDLFLGANQLSRESLDRFVATDAPVRWWHASQSRDADTGAPTNWSMVRVRDVSRIRSNVRQDFSHVLVILDVSKIREVPYAALSDYVAMVTLAQIDPQADMTGYSTVLNLFAAKAAGERMPPAMTNWDADYLRAMYTAPRDRRRASQQQRAIATSMTHGY